MAGPFGAIWGSQLGRNLGAREEDKRRVDEYLNARGIDKDVRLEAQQCASDLREAEDALRFVREAVESQSTLVKTRERSIAEAYSAAEAALRAGHEAEARAHLEERQRFKTKLEVEQIDLAEAERRVESMAESVSRLAARAAEIEKAVSRAMVAGSPTDPCAPSEEIWEPEEFDPLAAKFRRLEGR